MSSNVLKSKWVSIDPNEKRIINADELFESKVAAQSSENQKPYAFGSFDEAEREPDEETLDGGQMEALFGEEGIYQEEESTPEEISQEPDRDELMAQMQEEIEAMKQQAISEIESMKQQAYERASAEGREAGYQDGYQEAQKVVQDAEEQKQQALFKQQQLETEYQQKMDELEPLFVDHLTDIYEHIFRVEFSDDREIIMHLLDTALHNIGSGKDFLIRVSKEDYPFVSMQKKKLSVGMASANIEILEDMTMKKGDAMIETGGGIFDCSVDVELLTLGKRLRLLAKNGEHENA